MWCRKTGYTVLCGSNTQKKFDASIDNKYAFDWYILAVKQGGKDERNHTKRPSDEEFKENLFGFRFQENGDLTFDLYKSELSLSKIQKVIQNNIIDDSAVCAFLEEQRNGGN